MNKLITAIVLSGLTLAALAHAAPVEAAEWRLGNGYRIFYRDHGNGEWRRMPGSATDVGDGWVIGTDRRNGGYGIYRWDGRTWHRMPGAGVKIGGSFNNPWVVNDRGERFSWTGYGWREEPTFGRRDDRRNGIRDDRNDGRRDEDWNNGRRDNDWNRGRRDNDANGRRDDGRGRDDDRGRRGRD